MSSRIIHPGPGIPLRPRANQRGSRIRRTISWYVIRTMRSRDRTVLGRRAHPVSLLARILAIILVAIPSLGAASRTAEGVAAESPDAGVPRRGPEGRSAPQFSLPDLRGGRVGPDYGAHPVTMVHFWATWCVPCMREIPDLNRLASRYEPSGAAIFAVCLDTATEAELRQIARAYDIRHTVLIGTAETARGFGGVPSFPTTYLVDARGRIVESFTGATRENHKRVEGSIRRMLEQAGRELPAEE